MDEFEKKKELDLYLERGTIVREYMKRIIELRSNAFQLANYYFVFQGVILAAYTSGTTALQPKDRWLLIGLSLLPAILNICAIVSIGLDYITTISNHEKCLAYYNRLYKKLYDPPPPQQQPGNAAAAATVDPNHIIKLYEDKFMKVIRIIFLSICIIVFLGFLVLTIIGCHTIMGREDDRHSNKNDQLLVDNEKCARFCVALWQEVGRSCQPCPPYP